MLHATLTRPDFDDPALRQSWDMLAAHSCSPFLRWSWAGCLARERYPDPWLFTVREAGTPVGIALLGRTRSILGTTLHMNQTGKADADSVFIEHNGVMAAPGREDAMLRALFGAARGRVMMSGVGDAWLAAARRAGGVLTAPHTRMAPFVRLDAAPALSRNTRAQLARSDRAYGAAPNVERAQTVDEALSYLGAMVPLHLDTWRRRGVASGLGSASAQAFLHALLCRAVPLGEAEMLRVTAGVRTLGYLLNLRAGGRVAAYASGFDYADAGPHEKPGLACHAAAIVQARQDGAHEYDFLAGDARYKRSLSNDARPLHWVAWQPTLSRFAAAVALRRRVRPGRSDQG